MKSVPAAPIRSIKNAVGANKSKYRVYKAADFVLRL